MSNTLAAYASPSAPLLIAADGVLDALFEFDAWLGVVPDPLVVPEPLEVPESVDEVPLREDVLFVEFPVNFPTTKSTAAVP